MLRSAGAQRLRKIGRVLTRHRLDQTRLSSRAPSRYTQCIRRKNERTQNISAFEVRYSAFQDNRSYIVIQLQLQFAELELKLIQTQMAQKPVLRAEVYAHAMRASQNRKKGSAQREGSIVHSALSKVLSLYLQRHYFFEFCCGLGCILVHAHSA